MGKNFDSDEAKRFLFEREKKDKEEKELLRKAVLQKVISILKDEFLNTSVEVYLVGSLIRPFSFSDYSDVDIVLKNYRGDRFDLWPKLESLIGRDVEIILFEKCGFQEFVLSEGLRVC